MYIDHVCQQIQPDSHQKKGSEQWSKVSIVSDNMINYSAPGWLIQRNILVLWNPWLCCLYYAMANQQLPLIERHWETLATWVNYIRTLRPGSFYKRTRTQARGLQGTYPQERFLVFLAWKIQDPLIFLFQIARGSRATLSECPFSLEKCTSLKDFFQKRPLQGFSSKEPGPGLLLLARLEEATRLLSSTMKHMGTY
jgi:hypothetical protein